MKDINIPRLDDNAPLPPFKEHVSNQIDWIRFYVASMEARLSTKIAVLTFVIVVVAFAVGFLFASVYSP